MGGLTLMFSRPAAGGACDASAAAGVTVAGAAGDCVARRGLRRSSVCTLLEGVDLPKYAEMDRMPVGAGRACPALRFREVPMACG